MIGKRREPKPEHSLSGGLVFTNRRTRRRYFALHGMEAVKHVDIMVRFSAKDTPILVAWSCGWVLVYIAELSSCIWQRFGERFSIELTASLGIVTSISTTGEHTGHGEQHCELDLLYRVLFECGCVHDKIPTTCISVPHLISY